MIEHLLKALSSFDASLVVLLVMSLVIIATVVSWHFDKKEDFHLQQVLIDNVSGKIVIEKVGYMVALAVSTWIMITLTIFGKMTEGYLAGYLAIFALSRAASSLTSVWKDAADDKARVLQKA